MKKIALFAAALMLCAGVTMAQEPVKKAKTTNAKPTTEAQATTDKGQAATTDKQGTQAKPAGKHCGNCPHHSQCNDKSQQKPAKPAVNTGKETKPQTAATQKK